MALLLTLPLIPSTYAYDASKTQLNAISEEFRVDTCDALLFEYALAYGLSESKTLEAYHTMRRESGFVESAANPTDSHKGSWGCSQINLSAHPNITKSQALNRHFAVNFMVSEFAAGNESKWTCWNEWYGGKPIRHCPQR